MNKDFKVDDIEFFKEKMDTLEYEENIYNQFAKSMAKATDIDLAKTPLVDLITGYIECKNYESYAKLIQERNDKAIEYISKLNSKGRDCEIYWDIKKEILNILRGEGE